MLRRTKIVATLGPATDDPAIMSKVIEAGVDVVRLNFSHGTHDVHFRRAQQALECARACGKHVGILVDLQGPKGLDGKRGRGGGGMALPTSSSYFPQGW